MPPCALLFDLDVKVSHGYWNGPWVRNRKLRTERNKDNMGVRKTESNRDSKGWSETQQ